MKGRGVAERGALYVFLGVGGRFFKQIIQIATQPSVWKSQDPYFAGWLANRQQSVYVWEEGWVSPK